MKEAYEEGGSEWKDEEGGRDVWIGGSVSLTPGGAGVDNMRFSPVKLGKLKVKLPLYYLSDFLRKPSRQTTNQTVRSMLVMLGVLAILGILSIARFFH